jgi:hypothetical protein
MTILKEASKAFWHWLIGHPPKYPTERGEPQAFWIACQAPPTIINWFGRLFDFRKTGGPLRLRVAAITAI